MNNLFKWTILLIIIFILAILYYVYIWISFKPLDPLGGDSKQVVILNEKYVVNK